MKLPRAPAPLPRDFAEALGQAVAAFGFLEEALKHAIHSLSRDRLGNSPTEGELDAWVTRMEQIRGDSLGTLIESFVTACLRCRAPQDLREELEEIRNTRNMLCHASWKPVAADQGGGWRPAFVASRNRPVPARIGVADLRSIRARTLVLARRAITIARDAGYADIDTHDRLMIEAERARARARTARGSQGPKRRRIAPHPAANGQDDAGGQPWHPLDQDDYESVWRRPRHGRSQHH